jgi:hypothetical protein
MLNSKLVLTMNLDMYLPFFPPMLSNSNIELNIVQNATPLFQALGTLIFFTCHHTYFCLHRLHLLFSLMNWMLLEGSVV